MIDRFSRYALVGALCANALTHPAALRVTEEVQEEADSIAPTIDAKTNTIGITEEGQILWNEWPVTIKQVEELLSQSAAMKPEPQLTYAPDVNASFERSADVLKLVMTLLVTNFGFIGNDKGEATEERDD